VHELGKSEARVRLLVDGLEDDAVYMLDPAGRITSGNAGAERITGYAAA
jgi:PAS domain S-box-containing protein